MDRADYPLKYLNPVKEKRYALSKTLIIKGAKILAPSGAAEVGAQGAHFSHVTIFTSFMEKFLFWKSDKILLSYE